ncbi:MAG: hormogonium polysaccharide secretion pseudopilin HpsC [Aphanizomenon gracile PMC649.10]|nr:hormogonium polysaccharide secretion pseudopilin HpsC [Aphanizomenon gracile PMC649.10]
MVKTLKFILKSQIKSSKIIQKPSGFTLIELLVAMVIAFLIITPLLSFMISVLNTDAQEQAKSNTEQELQTAINYIARDLQQAIYIYDAAGVTAISSQLPSATTQTPLLVFWKRQLVNNVVTTATSGSNDDTFVYSLVAYYLIKDSSTTWSNSARIARWSIKDGVQVSSGVACTGYNAQYITDYCPDAGFSPFSAYFTQSDSLDSGMQKWQKTSASYGSNAPVVLIDYVDQTTTSPPAATCPASTTTPPITWSTIKPSSMTGFYVCVDKANTTAQIFIRGNALARTNISNINYSSSNTTYFPQSSVTVKGRGYYYQ